MAIIATSPVDNRFWALTTLVMLIPYCWRPPSLVAVTVVWAVLMLITSLSIVRKGLVRIDEPPSGPFPRRAGGRAWRLREKAVKAAHWTAVVAAAVEAGKVLCGQKWQRGNLAAE
ncbi:hypothetical protein VTH82DRAFT_7013 [Thermothelomyces myriococcoides]